MVAVLASEEGGADPEDSLNPLRERFDEMNPVTKAQGRLPAVATKDRFPSDCQAFQTIENDGFNR